MFCRHSKLLRPSIYSVKLCGVEIFSSELLFFYLMYNFLEIRTLVFCSKLIFVLLLLVWHQKHIFHQQGIVLMLTNMCFCVTMPVTVTSRSGHQKRIERFIGNNGINIIRKVFGVVLLAIAVKLFATNIKELF